MIHALLVVAVLALAGTGWWIVRLRSDVRRLAEWHRCSELQKLDAHRIGRERKVAIRSLNAQVRELTQQAASRSAGHRREIAQLGFRLRTTELELARQQQAHGVAIRAQMAAHARTVGQVQEDLHSAYKARMRALEASLEAMLEPSRNDECIKIRHHHQDQAERFARELEEDNGMDEGIVQIYRCSICPRSPWTIEKYFHVTSNGHRGEINFARPKADTLAGRFDNDTIAALRKRVNGETA